MGHVIKRISETYAAPSLSSTTGRPVNWRPTSQVREDWGTIRVVMGGVDVSAFRGAPYSALRYSLQSPFGCGPAQVSLPRLYHWDTLGYGALTWCRVGADVDIVHVSPALATVKTLWSGSIGDYLWNADGSIGFALVGDLWDDDFQGVHQYRALRETDLGVLIADTLNAVISRRHNRSTPVARVTTGITTRRRAGQNQPVVQYIQDLLSSFGTTVDGADTWTVERIPGQARAYEIRTRRSRGSTWTYRVGQRGFTQQLVASGTTLPNCIYASGTNDKGESWSGLRFPLGPANTLATTRLPIAYTESIRPRLWDFTTGQDLGDNPLYDPVVRRIEADYPLGAGTSRADAYRTLRPALDRQARIGIAGTITATLDFQEGSRYDVREGDIIRVLGLQGYASKDLRVAQIDATVVSPQDPDGSVTFTVDELERHLAEIVSTLQHDEEARNDPARLPVRAARAAALKRDRTIPFDAESLAGYVKANCPAGTWTIIDVPVSELGDIAVIDLATSPATEFAVAFFADAPQEATDVGWPGPQRSDLASLVGNPLADYGGQGPFDRNATDLDLIGFIQGFGAYRQACGYSRKESIGDGYQTSPYNGSTGTLPLTGRFYSQATWSYTLTTPPFMRIAVWPVKATTISGRLVPAPAEV